MKNTTIALAVASSLLSLGADANSATNNTTVDDVIVVTASRTTQEKFDVLASVDVFDRADIERIQPTSVADLLDRVAGISVTTQGSQAHNTSLFVRGTNSNHVLILIDGVRVGSGSTGVKSLTTVPVQLIDRVEIVKGPRAAIWGSDAIGGVIQIFTRQQQQGDGQVGATLGDENFQQVYGAIGFGNESHQYTISLNAERANGFDVRANVQPDADGFNHKTIGINGTSKITESYSVKLNAQLEQGNTQFDATFGGDETDHDNHYIAIGNQLTLDGLSLALNYANIKDSTDTFGNEANPSFITTKRDQLSLLAQTQLGNNHLVGGVEWYNEDVVSGPQFSNPALNNFNEQRDAYSVFITDRYQAEQLKLEGSVRYDNIGDTKTETTYQLAAGYDFNGNFNLALSHGTSFKVPTFNQLFFPFFGTPDLVSEESENTELIARYHNDILSAEFSVYYNQLENLIISDPITFLASNIDEVKVRGAEANITLDLDKTSHNLLLSHTDSENQSTGLQLIRRPYFTANYTASYQGNDWDLNLDIQHVGKRFDGFTVLTELGSYTTFDLIGQIKLKQDWRLSVKLSNIFDKQYETTISFPNNGRGFRLGVDYRF